MLRTTAIVLDDTHIAYLDRLAQQARDGRRSRSFVTRYVIDCMLRADVDWSDIEGFIISLSKSDAKGDDDLFM